jgi:hypothetical protein
MKTVKIIDLLIYAEKHTNIRLDRSVLYSYQAKGLKFIKNQSYKYLNFQNLELIVIHYTTDDELLKWYMVFEFYLNHQKKIKRNKELQKKVDLQLANLANLANMVFCPTRGFMLRNK